MSSDDEMKIKVSSPIKKVIEDGGVSLFADGKIKSESSDSTSGADEGCEADDPESSPCDDESANEDISKFLSNSGLSRTHA